MFDSFLTKYIFSNQFCINSSDILSFDTSFNSIPACYGSVVFIIIMAFSFTVIHIPFLFQKLKLTPEIFYHRICIQKLFGNC